MVLSHSFLLQELLFFIDISVASEFSKVSVPFSGPLDYLIFDEERYFSCWLVVLDPDLIKRLFFSHFSSILDLHIKRNMEYTFLAGELDLPDCFLLAIGILPERSK